MCQSEQKRRDLCVGLSKRGVTYVSFSSLETFLNARIKKKMSAYQHEPL